MLASTYIFQTPENPECHKHDHAHIIVGINGVSNIEIEEDRIEVDRMLGCIIPTQTSHVFFGARENLNLTVNFDLRYSNDLVKRICEAPRSFSLDRSFQTFLKFSAMELPEFHGSTNIGRDTFCQHIVGVLTSLLGNRIFNKPETEKRIDLSRIDHYLHKVMHQKISIEKLASLSHMSQSHFFTLFRQQTGTTPHQYIIEKRLEKAMLLLKTTHLSISEISFETGFSSQSALNNAFKNHYGCTPGSVKQSQNMQL